MTTNDALSTNGTAARWKNNRATAIVDAAYAGGYAVAAVCCYDIEAVPATVRTAEAKQSPALIQLFPRSIEFARLLLLHAAREAADKVIVPIGVHMDHVQSPDIIRRSADLGDYHRIMVDMSHYEKDESMRLSKELVENCDARGISTECELGRINGTEDGISDTEGMEKILTTPEQAEDYGPKGPQLDFLRLAQVHKQVGDRMRLVLHEARKDYFKEEPLKKCISYGTAKVNVNGPVAAARTKFQGELTGKVPLTMAIEEQTNAMQAVAEYHMYQLMSTGKE